MDFDYSPKTKELQAKLQTFMSQHIYPAEGAYHAEIIDKVGGMVGRLTYGVSKDAAVAHFEQALKLTPQSAIAHIEFANGLLMLFGDNEMDRATALYEKAAKLKGKDAMEVLDIEMAKAELEDE